LYDVFLGASAVVFDGITSPGILKVLACREGIAVADDLDVGPMHLATDCLNVVNDLCDGDLGEYSVGGQGQGVTPWRNYLQT
jgi:hypothetical protein